MDQLLAFAAELEGRDAQVAARLADIEQLQREVGELGTRSTEVCAFLVSLPAALAARTADERAALEARTRSEIALRQAEAAAARARGKDERLAAAQAARQADADIHAAERRAEEASAEARRLEREGDAHAEEGRQLGARAVELSALVEGVPVPANDLAGAIEWASHARGVLLVTHSVLAREREAIVREASELISSVLGESLTVTAAALRGRLERALAVRSA